MNNSKNSPTIKFSFFSLILTILLISFAYFDVTTSAQAGNIESDRSNIYVLVFFMFTFFLMYTLLNLKAYFFRLHPIPLLLIISIWLLLCNVMNDGLTRPAQIHLLQSILWISIYYSHYHYCTKNRTKSIIAMYSIILLVYIGVNIYAQNNIRIQYDREIGMTSFSYYLLAIFPIILLIKHKTLKTIFILLVFIFTFISMKRGPIITLCSMYFIHTLISNKLSHKKGSLWKWIIMLSIGSIAAIAIDNLSEGFLFARFSSEELTTASGRDQIWTIAIQDITQRDWIVFFSGRGSGSSVKLVGTGIHNEWLEFLFSFGFIGLALYAVLFARLFKRARFLIRKKSIYAPIYSVIFVFFLLSGLSDGFFFVYWSIYFFTSLGIVEALITKNMYQHENMHLYRIN